MPAPTPYLLLALFWFVYGAVHSLLASLTVKRWVEQHLSGLFRAYRVVYNAFSSWTLILLVTYQVSIPAYRLLPVYPVLSFLGGAMALTGLALVVRSLIGYDMKEFTGVRRLVSGLPPPSVFRQDGLLRYVRHPLYFGTLLVVWGIFAYLPLLANLVTALCVTAYTVVGSRLEERKLLLEFGDAYHRYRREVPGLLPLRRFRRG